MPFPVVPVVGGGAALWLLSKLKRKATQTSSSGSGAVNPGFVEGKDVDLAGDVANDEPDCFDDLQFAAVMSGQAGQMRMDRVYRQLWLPASKVLPSQISPQQWRYAAYLLSGSLHRHAELEYLYKRLMDENRKRGDDAAGLKITSTIASVIPVIGGILSSGMQSMASQLISASNAMTIDAANMAGSIKKSVDIANMDPPAKMLLMSTVMANGGDAVYDLSVTPWLARQGVYVYRPNLITTVPVGYSIKVYPVAEWKKTPQPVEGITYKLVTDYRMHLRFFTCWQYGMLLPWISDELTGPNLRFTVNLRARIFRAIEILSVTAYPDTVPTGLTNFTGSAMGLYYYRNPVYGAQLGTIFPPTEEDVNFIDDKGTRYTAFGTAMRSSASAAGQVGTINLPGYTPDPNSPEARQGNGEVFCWGDQCPPPSAPLPPGTALQVANLPPPTVVGSVSSIKLPPPAPVPAPVPLTQTTPPAWMSSQEAARWLTLVQGGMLPETAAQTIAASRM